MNDADRAAGLTERIPQGLLSALQDTADRVGQLYREHLPQPLEWVLDRQRLPQTLEWVREPASNKPEKSDKADKPDKPGKPSAAARATVDFSVIAKTAVRPGAIGGMAATPDGTKLVVTNHGANSVSVIDTGTFAVVNRVVGTNEPFAIAVGSSAHTRAYVSAASPAHDSIVAVDLNTNAVVATYPLARSVGDVAVSPNGKRVYASRTGSDGADIAVLDSTTGQVDSIEIAAASGTTAGCLSISPNGRRLYVATHGPSGGELAVIDARGQRVIETIEIGSAIRDVAVSNDGRTAYVASCHAGSGALIDIIDIRTRKITTSLEVGEIGGVVTQLALSSDGDRLYLINNDSVIVLCTITHDILATITMDKQPACVTESLDGNYLYVADYCGTVTVVSVASSPEELVAEANDDEFIAALDLLRLEPALV